MTIEPPEDGAGRRGEWYAGPRSQRWVAAQRTAFRLNLAALRAQLTRVLEMAEQAPPSLAPSRSETRAELAAALASTDRWIGELRDNA